MKLTDDIFLRMTRAAASGGVNPGHDLGLLGPELSARAADTADMRENLWLLYAITVGMKATRVLEIGTNDGTSTLAFAKAVAETGGKVTTVDITEVPVAQALIDKLELGGHVEFIRGDSKDVLPRLHAEGRQFDAALIDGDHSHVGAWRDLEMVDKLLVTGGVVFTHDNWMMAVDVDMAKPVGQRGTPGCGLLGVDMMTGVNSIADWRGVIFPFGSNLGVWRRWRDVFGELMKNAEAARQQGLIP